MPKNNFAEKLAKEGFNFQKYCAKAIRRVGWKVREEYPFSHHQIPSSGCLDILAQFNDERHNHVIYSMVECKKMDPSYERLVMYKSTRTRSDGVIHPQYCITKPDPSNLTFPLLRETEICDICKELVRDPESNKIKMRSKKIKIIGNHLNHALISITSEVNSATQQLQKSGHSIPSLQVFVPVFVTGANLLIFDVSDKLGNDSKLDIEAKGTPANWCIYEFPVRKHHPLPAIPQFINPFKKLAIFIVNVKSVASFFERLRSIHHPK